MMFSWRCFLAVARELAQRDDEAYKRTAISRAYYCVFNCCRQLVEHEGEAVPDEARSHAFVWNTPRPEAGGLSPPDAIAAVVGHTTLPSSPLP